MRPKIFSLRKNVVLVNFLIIFGSNINAQIADFNAPDQACVNQLIEVENNSLDADAFTWDLCFGEFDPSIIPSIEDIQTVSGVNFPRGMDLVYDTLNSNYHLFFSDRALNQIYRMDIGSSLSNPNISVEILNVSGDPLVNPEDIKILKNPDGVWCGFVGSSSNGEGISRLNFGTTIASDPTNTNIGTLGLGSVQIRGLDVLYAGNEFIFVGLEVVGERIITCNLGNSLFNSFSSPFISSSLSGGTNATGIDLVRNGSEWIAYVAFIDGGGVFRMNFGNDLFSDPIIEDQYDFTEFNRPHRVKVFRNHSSFKALVTNFNSGTVLLNLGDLSISESVTLTDYSLNQSFEVDGGFFEGNYHFYQVDNGSIEKIDFVSTCDNVVNYSTDVDLLLQPVSSEDINLELTAINGSLTDFQIDTIFLQPDIAPSISYTSDNVCISFPIIFTPSNNGLNTYSWDFNGDDIIDVVDMTGADQSFDYSTLGAGTYTVRLDVSDGTCDNFYEEEITIYDPPPNPSYSFSSPRTCVNTDYTFSNTTSDGSYTGPLEYLWEFIDEPSGNVVATADTRDAIYAFETEGQKTVRLTSSIPGCSEVIEQTLMIAPGPTASFSATSVCQGENMQFTNNSADATTYSWNFGDGFMSSSENPSHVYSDAGNYFVTLVATDAEGCDDTEIVEVAVSDAPQINFDFDVPCTSSDGIQFMDLTAVNNANVVSWNWFVDGVEVSTVQNPIITFNSTGIKTIRLDVQGSNGCESSYTEDIEILTAPTPDFSSSIGCQNEESTFTDITVVSGNPIVSWLWTIDGSTYTTQNITHVFEDPGIFDVSLEITGQNFCSETIIRTVEIRELPSVDFIVTGECENQLIQATDESIEVQDPIVSRRWLLDGENVGNGEQLFLESLNNDSYELALELETSTGCTISGIQTLEINTSPVSSFISSRTYGIPNDQLTFTNTSSGSISHHWILDGEMRSSDTSTENITFLNPGIYGVGIVTENSLGCLDTATQEILIAIPEVDLKVGNFELVDENGIGKIFLEINNSSNLPVELTDVQVILESQFSVNEQVLAFIDVGETELVTLNVGVPLTVSEPSYFCVRLNSQYVNFPDINPIDNEKCLTIQPLVSIEDPFPNPVNDQFRLKVVLPDGGEADLMLINSAGKIQQRETFNADSGLNNFFVEMDNLDPGVYFVTVTVLGTIHKRKIIKL